MHPYLETFQKYAPSPIVGNFPRRNRLHRDERCVFRGSGR